MAVNEQDYLAFKQLLGMALASIPAEYIQMPVCGREEPIYRERVFCYELYHQLRRHWRKDCIYTLAGEVDKAGHPLVRTERKPDFLIHSRGDMDANFVVMEVKPCSVDACAIEKDFKTLTWFINEARYQHRVLLVYGVGDGEFRNVSEIISRLKPHYPTSNGVSLDVVFCKYQPPRGVVVEWLGG